MYHSPTNKVNRISSNRPYIAMYQDTWMWETVKWGNKFKLNYKKMPTSQPEKLYFIEDFRGGVDGRVWLACTPNGEMCAIKFDHEESKTSLEKEANYWKLIWNKINTQVITLGGRPALMMPFMKNIENWNDPTIIEDVLEAAKKMAKLGFVHKDLKKPHVGYMSPKKKNARNEVVFYDLRQIEEMNEEESLKLMLETLNIN